MSKKRNANSPMESEKGKQKASTSAAASTLGMAAMLSAVSNVFSSANNDSSSQASESEDEYSQATGGNSTITNDNDNPWNEENLAKSQVKSPKKHASGANKIEPLFEYHHEGAWRDEIEVEIQTKNKKRFTGSITPIEAKHLIYKGLGFTDHSNFDGVRINFKGKLIVTFKLIRPINIDELDTVEHFEFKRISTTNGKRNEEIIGCRIRGIRYRPLMVSSFDNVEREDGIKVVKIEGCEYRVTKDEILQWLSHYGEVTSDLEEDCFREEVVSEGNNRTGNYTVMMKLDKQIPQLLPMCGKRVKMYHAGIQKLCTNCFGPHKKQHCEAAEKVPWVQYVRKFIEENEEIQPELFGKWIEIIQKIDDESGASASYPRREHGANATNSETIAQPTQSEEKEKEKETSVINEQDDKQTPEEPNPKDFNIPTTDEEYESMIDRFNTVGISRTEADEAIKNRTTAYNRACREYKKMMTEKRKQTGNKQPPRSRRGSLKNNKQ